MQKFVIGDIHGGLKALIQVLKKIKISEKDLLIFLGDYVDGWSESPEVINYLITLKDKYNCIFIKGNHDDLLLNYLKTKSFNKEWLIHGGSSTIKAYEKINLDTINKHISFLESLKEYFIDEDNRLYIHAGFTNQKGVEYEYFKPSFYWDRTLWETAISLNPNISFDDILYPNRLKIYKEIYIGHTPVTKINKTTPHQASSVWNVDTGAAFTGSLSILNVDTKEFWQSDSLPLLYPNEKGRN
ncbi:serine/threonine protein phosphatase [Flavobacterium sediminilitoris]|uniref:Serine/threonine protein phosphatase n=1 Tax=Flavobacterium sediminilitoris TaxID=2024526 RepID=A0ABY4HQ51_9FLAO|nr:MULTISPECIES: metallophosphoesterase family protein [Flavobacterium]UOX34818.1 serine/threonine protein phosphatase [Flavobacterium sediminilitoris]